MVLRLRDEKNAKKFEVTIFRLYSRATKAIVLKLYF